MGEAADEAGEHLCGGPEEEPGAENGAGSGAVEEADEGELGESVGERKGGEEPAHLGGAEVHFGADGGVGDGEGGPVEEVDQAGEEEQTEGDGLMSAQGAGSGGELRGLDGFEGHDAASPEGAVAGPQLMVQEEDRWLRTRNVLGGSGETWYRRLHQPEMNRWLLLPGSSCTLAAVCLRICCVVFRAA